jgi:hypothetical protein
MKAAIRLTHLREIIDSDVGRREHVSDVTPPVRNDGYCHELHHDRFFLGASVLSSDHIDYSGLRQHD